MLLDKIKIAFLSSLNQVIMFTGHAEKPTEKYNITANVHDALIGMYLTKPGIIRAPDGAEFLLELTLLPASREAKQRLLDEAQAEINAANTLQPPPAEGSPDAVLLSKLTTADRDLLDAIFKARKAGQRVTMRYPPFKAEVKFGPVPPKPKKPKLVFPEPIMERGDLKWSEDKSIIDFVPNPEGKSFFESHPKIEPYFNDEVSQQQTMSKGPININVSGEKLTVFMEDANMEAQTRKMQASLITAPDRIPVVVLTIPESDSHHMIIERSQWDAYAVVGQSSGRSWVEGGRYVAAGEIGCNPEDITHIDFEQTRSREELDNLPDFQH